MKSTHDLHTEKKGIEHELINLRAQISGMQLEFNNTGARSKGYGGALDRQRELKSKIVAIDIALLNRRADNPDNDPARKLKKQRMDGFVAAALPALINTMWCGWEGGATPSDVAAEIAIDAVVIAEAALAAVDESLDAATIAPMEAT